MTLHVREGVVRLTAQDWKDLVESPEAPAEIADLPGFTRAITAARKPVLQLQLDVAADRLTTRHHAWVDLEAVALLAQVRGDEHQVMAFPPSFLAGALARLTRLGPHRTGPRKPRDVEEGLLDDLFHADDMRRFSAYQLLGVRLAWMLATFGSETELRLAVVEDERGAWLAEPGEAGWRMTPTDATALWRRLTTLVVDTADPAR